MASALLLGMLSAGFIKINLGPAIIAIVFLAIAMPPLVKSVKS